MKRKTSIRSLTLAVGLALGSSLTQASLLEVVDGQVVMNWSGLFTMLDTLGNPCPIPASPITATRPGAAGHQRLEYLHIPLHAGIFR